MRVSRRGFLKTVASATLLASMGVPAEALQIAEIRYPLGSIAKRPEIRLAKVTSATCLYCAVTCNLLIYSFNGKVLYVSGDPESSINAGRACPKGLALAQMFDNPGRVLRPRIRTGPKPPVDKILDAKSWDELLGIVKQYPPNWKEVSWEEALDYIASKIKKVLDGWRDKTGQPKREDGYYYTGAAVPVQFIGSSVMVNEPGYLNKKLATYVGSANMDSQYRKCHSSTVASLAATLGWGAETATFDELPSSGVVLFFSSPAEAHPVSMSFFMEAKRKGAILIVFDPRFSRTAMVADIWAPFRSGTETAILNYILHYAFFERRPPIDELEEFKRLMKEYWNITSEDLADLKEMLKEYNAEEVSRITGVPVDILKLVAEIYVENSGVVTNHKKHGAIQWAMGMTQHTNATINIIRAASVVNILLGNTPYVGGGLHPFRGWSNVQGCTDVQGAGNAALPGYHGHPASAAEVRLYQDWKLQGFPDPWSWEIPDWIPGFEALKAAKEKGKVNTAKIMQWYKFYGWRRMELTWGVFCGTDPETNPEKGTVICDFPFGAGATEITFVRRALAGEIKAAFIFGENPAITSPNTKLVFAALASLDTLVVSDIFESETAWFADVLLPAALTFGESEGTKTQTARIVMWSYKAREPIGDARPDYWIITRIAERLAKEGVIKLPSQVYGKKSEKIVVRRGGGLVELYERPVDPMASWDYRGGTGASKPVGSFESEVNPRLINKEINFAVLIYDGMYNPVKDEFTS
ncbi:MAG: molybdopterin oxidoreductase family protein, partial [Acidilobaceae archaeon]